MTRENLEACALEDVVIPWVIQQKAKESGYSHLATECFTAIANTYNRVIMSERYRKSGVMSLEQFEEAKEFYQTALAKDPWMVAVHLKRVLLSFGKRGDCLRRMLSSFR